MSPVSHSVAFAMAFVGLVMAPNVASAKTSKKEKQEFQKCFKQLNRLPNAQTPPAKAVKLAKKCVKLEPKKAKKVYKAATRAILAAYVEAKARFLQRKFNAILDNSNLSARVVSRLKRQIAKILGRIFVTPTPTPYQARIEPVSGAGTAWTLEG